MNDGNITVNGSLVACVKSMNTTWLLCGTPAEAAFHNLAHKAADSSMHNTCD